MSEATNIIDMQADTGIYLDSPKVRLSQKTWFTCLWTNASGDIIDNNCLTSQYRTRTSSGELNPTTANDYLRIYKTNVNQANSDDFWATINADSYADTDVSNPYAYGIRSKIRETNTGSFNRSIRWISTNANSVWWSWTSTVGIYAEWNILSTATSGWLYTYWWLFEATAQAGAVGFTNLQTMIWSMSNAFAGNAWNVYAVGSMWVATDAHAWANIGTIGWSAQSLTNNIGVMGVANASQLQVAWLSWWPFGVWVYAYNPYWAFWWYALYTSGLTYLNWNTVVNGKLGIGITTPSTALQISGNAYITSTLSQVLLVEWPRQIWEFHQYGLVWTTTDDTLNIKRSNTISTWQYNGSILEIEDSWWYPSNGPLMNIIGFGSTNYLTFTSGGYMWLHGITIPQYALDVSGAVQTNNAFYITGWTTPFRFILSGNTLSIQWLTWWNRIQAWYYSVP
jgi:hypothetical protein